MLNFKVLKNEDGFVPLVIAGGILLATVIAGTGYTVLKGADIELDQFNELNQNTFGTNDSATENTSDSALVLEENVNLDPTSTPTSTPATSPRPTSQSNQLQVPSNSAIQNVLKGSDAAITNYLANNLQDLKIEEAENGVYKIYVSEKYLEQLFTEIQSNNSSELSNSSLPLASISNFNAEFTSKKAVLSANLDSNMQLNVVLNQLNSSPYIELSDVNIKNGGIFGLVAKGFVQNFADEFIRSVAEQNQNKLQKIEFETDNAVIFIKP